MSRYDTLSRGGIPETIERGLGAVAQTVSVGAEVVHTAVSSKALDAMPAATTFDKVKRNPTVGDEIKMKTPTVKHSAPHQAEHGAKVARPYVHKLSSTP